MALFVFLPQSNCFAQAPDIEWQKTFGGSSSDEGESIVQTSDGGYIIAGWTHSNDFDVSGNHAPGDGDCWIIKTALIKSHVPICRASMASEYIPTITRGDY